jgi:hypothetical protein
MNSNYELTEESIDHVLKRLQWRMFSARSMFNELHGYSEPINASAYKQVDVFYTKRLAERRKEFNRKSSTKNLCLLKKAMLASNAFNEKLDLIKFSEYSEAKYA